MADGQFGLNNGSTSYLPNTSRDLVRPSAINANQPSTYSALSIYNRPGYKGDLYGISSASAANASLIAAALRRAEEERRRLEMMRRQQEAILQRQREQAMALGAEGRGPVPMSPTNAFDRFQMLRQAREMGAEGTFYKGPEAQFQPSMGEEQGPAWQRARGFDIPQVDLSGGIQEPYTVAPLYPEGTDDTTGLPVPGTKYDANGNIIQESGFMPFEPQGPIERAIALKELYAAFPYLQDDVGDLSLSSEPDGDAIAKSARGRAISQEDFAKGTRAAARYRNFDAEYRKYQIDIWGQPTPRYYEEPGETVTYINPKTGQERTLTIKEPKRELIGEDWGYFGDGTEGPTGKKVEYLGLNPGEVPIRKLPKKPAPDAPYIEWKRYSEALDNVFAKPLYKPEDPYKLLSMMDSKTIREFQRGLVEAKLYEPGHVYVPGLITPEEIEKMTAIMTLANLNGTDWQTIMETQKARGREFDAMSSSYGGGGGGGGGTTTYKQIQYTQTSVAQARALMVNVLQSALGRYPTDSEVQRFLEILNKAESKSPSKTITTTTTGGDFTKAVSRSTPSAVDPQALAEEFARSIGGGAEFRAKSDFDYLSGLFESLGEMGV